MTGLVIAVVAGTLVQGNGGIGRLLSGSGQVEPKDDVFFVRTDRPETLDVMVNDIGVDASMPLEIVDYPTCGELEISNAVLVFTPDELCVGKQTITYCVVSDYGCMSANVAVTVHDTGIEETDGALAKLDPMYAEVAPDKTAALTGIETEEMLDEAEPEPVLAALPTTEPVPVERNFTDPYLQALAGIVEWQPDGGFLPDTPSALLMGDAPSSVDPTYTVNFLWKPIVPRPQPIETGTSDLLDDQRTDAAPALLMAQEFDLAKSGASDPAVPLENDTAALPQSLGAFQLVPALGNTDQTGALLASTDNALIPAPSDDDLPELCPVHAAVEEKPGAHLDVTVVASCLAGQSLILNHGGLDFAFDMPGNGQLQTTIPALSSDSTVAVRDSAERAVAIIPAPAEGYADIARFAMVLPQDAAVSLVALESNQSSGVVRELTIRNAITHQDAQALGRGYIRSYDGPDGTRIATYTLPRSERTQLPEVTLKLRLPEEAPCGQTVLANIAQGLGVAAQVIAMPPCGSPQVATVDTLQIKP